MSWTSTHSGWRELYRLALLEPDPSLLSNRIDEAQKAIQSRAVELLYLDPAETKERHELDTASYFLGLLAMIEPRLTPDYPANDRPQDMYDA